jgi:thymidylate synthase (FAD)
MKVELIDHMGSDLSVVNAARVSFDKVSTEFQDRDTKLINYLATHNHWSPFAHCFASFRVAAPVFVARQLQKHTVGLSWNEVSRRYVDSEPTFFVPETWRKRAENVKQGSGEELANGKKLYWFNEVTEEREYLTEFYDHCLATYMGLLRQGVCPEQARMVLPQSMMTEWIWSGSLYAFARVCNLRLDSHTQKETQLVAQQISSHMESLFPVSWNALVGVRNTATPTED